jgi:hypothetical protein
MSTVDKVIALMKSEVGYHEGYSNGHWNNKEKYAGQVPGLEWADWQAWCATFVSWVFLKSGLPKDAYCTTASVATAREWAKRNKRFSEYPAIGAQAIFGINGDVHTGIVYGYDNTYIYTVEGNTNINGSAEGDGVYYKKRVRKDSFVYGYLYPKYPEGIVSADPAWADQQPKPKPPTPSKPPVPPSKPVTKLVAFSDLPPTQTGTKSAIWTAMGKRLVAEGCGLYNVGPGPVLSETDIASYEKWQRKLGFKGKDAMWPPGPASWNALKVPA